METVKTVQISVGNGRFYGGALVVDWNAAPDDGRLDVALVPSLRRGTHKRWRTFSATSLVIETRRARDIDADDEIVSETPATIHIKNKVVRVFAALFSDTAG